MSSFVKRVASTSLTLAVAAVAGLACHAAGVPAPWLMGGTIAVSALALMRVGGDIPPPLFNVCMVFLGASMGVSVSPAALEGVAGWPGSMAGLAVSVVAIIGASVVCLRYIAKWDWQTSLFASFPGAFIVVMAMAQETRADVPRVVVSQVLRVFLLITIIPLLVSHVDHPPALVRPVVTGSIQEYALLGALCTLGGLAAHALRMPGGLLIGSFMVSAVLHATEISTVTLPPVLQTVGMVVLSASIGRRFARLHPRAILSWIGPSLMAFAAAFLVTAASAGVVSWLVGIPFAQLLLAYMPGVLEGMILLAFALGIDPVFVSAHQLARFLVLMLIVPLIARRTRPDGEDPG